MKRVYKIEKPKPITQKDKGYVLKNKPDDFFAGREVLKKIFPDLV